MITSDQFTHRRTDDAAHRVPMCTRCTRVWVDDAWLVPLPIVVAVLEGTDTFTYSLCGECADALIAESSAECASRPVPARLNRAGA